MDEHDLEIEQVTRRNALIAAGLFIENPEQIEGLVYPVPGGVRPERLLREYETKATIGRKVRCSFCKSHSPHYRGFVAELADNSPALIGINCGEEHFGKGKWDEMRAHLVREQDRVHFEARIAPALRQIEIIHPLIDIWRRQLEIWGRFRRSIKSVLPDLNTALLSAAALREGRLEREKMKTIDAIDENGRAIQRRVPDITGYGRIPHPEVLTTQAPDGKAAAVKTMVQQAFKELQKEGNVKSIAGAFSTLRSARRQVDDIQDLHTRWVRMADMEWWQDACRWMKATDGGQYRVAGRFVIESNYGQPYKVAVPAPDGAIDELYRQITAAWPS